MVLSNPNWPADFFEQQQYITTLLRRLQNADKKAGMVSHHGTSEPSVADMKAAWEEKYGDSAIPVGGRIQWFNSGTNELELTYTRKDDGIYPLFTREPATFQAIQTLYAPNNDSNTSFLFSAIPQTYRHLMLRGQLKDTAAVVNYVLRISPNSYTTAVYDNAYIGHGGTTAVMNSNLYNGMGFNYFLPSTNATTPGYLHFEMIIYDYTKNNQIVADQGLAYTLIGGVADYLGNYRAIFSCGGPYQAISRAIAPVTSLLIDTTGTSFDKNSWLTLYGIHDYDTMVAAM